MPIDSQLADEFETKGRIWLRDVVPEGDAAFIDNVVAIEAKPGQRIDINYKNAAAFSLSSVLVRAVQVIDPKAKPVRIVGFTNPRIASGHCHGIKTVLSPSKREQILLALTIGPKKQAFGIASHQSNCFIRCTFFVWT